jgi:tRNA pseudouridine55 synthase
MSRRNKKGRDINGVVLLDKSVGNTSNHALQRVKRLFDAKKAGHTGSLDPLASGLLPICFGQATKVAQYLLDNDKRYFVVAKLGQISSTGDIEGDIESFGSTNNIDKSSIRIALRQFIGEIDQVPPMFSALKRNGTPLYKLARKGIEVEREARVVTINKINILSYKEELLSLDVSCSKGTYIRTLVEDIGKALGCGGYVIELRRTGFAHFDIVESRTYEQLLELKKESMESLDSVLLGAHDMLPEIESLYLDAKQTADIRLGRKIQYGSFDKISKVKLFDNKQNFVGIGQTNLLGELLPKRLFV